MAAQLATAASLRATGRRLRGASCRRARRAVMSHRMITGGGLHRDRRGQGEVGRLGLVEGVIVDQHFVKRQRQNRLFGLVLKHPDERGVGIDEDTALLVSGGHRAEVVGKGPVVLVDADGKIG